MKYRLLLVLLLLCQISFSQINEDGIPFIRNFTTDDYNAGTQNFSIVQDNRGVMYFANSNVVMEFDGINWKKIRIPKNPFVLSLAKDNKGVIYVGAIGDFGYLSSNNNGVTTFISLKDLLPEEDQNTIARIRKIAVTQKNEVIFISTDALLVYYQNKIKILKKKSKNEGAAFLTYFEVNGRFFIHEKFYGIHEYKNGEIELLPGTKMFAYKWVTGMFPFADDKIKIIENQKKPKSYIYHNGNITEVPENILVTNLFYSVPISENHYALGLFENGFLITDKKLNPIKHITEDKGLQNNQTFYVYNDLDSNIWLGLANGISVIYQNSPFSVYKENYGLNSSTYSSLIHDDKLYVGNATGIFYLEMKNKNAIDTALFKKVDIKRGSQIWKIDTVNNVLLCAGTNGFMYVEDNKATYIKENESTRTFIRLKDKPNFLITAGKNINLYQFINKKWVYKFKIKGYDKDCRHIQQDSDGNFWISDRLKGVYKFNLTKKMDSIINLTFFDKTKGLPDNLENFVSKVNGKIVFATKKGIYEVNETKDKIIESEFFKNIFKREKHITNIYQDKKGDIWFKEQRTRKINKDKETIWELGLIAQHADSFTLIKTPFYKVMSDIHSFNSISENELLIGNEKGFVIYDKFFKKNYYKKFTSLVRGVELLANDSLIFGGTYIDTSGAFIVKQPNDKIPVLPFKYNGLRFTYAGLYYEEPGNILYQIYLEGNDIGWSDWKPETTKEYSNLHEGKYNFKIKAKNIYGIESIVAEFEFEILPPWYRTIWAIIAYIILSILFIWLIVKLSLRRVTKQKEHLERVVEERTAKIKMQNEELNAQKEEIEDQNKQLSIINEEVKRKNADITSSITYAQRIQEAMLPLKERINHFLPDNFILFKPRDIVSGDFYWFDVKNDKIIITAVDCTGHGVPGAFMSMIGSEILTAIVNKEITDADEILATMNQYVVKALKQDETSNQDGMDMALCVIDNESNTVQYSGAKNPLVYIKNNELYQVKPSRCAIGGVQKKEPSYQKEIIEITEPTYFYIFSDGFQDQFGGPKLRKYMIKRLKALFLEIHKKPFKEQHAILENEINEWMKNTRQTDDILVIGFKLDPNHQS